MSKSGTRDSQNVGSEETEMYMDTEASFVAPRTPVEKTLADICGDLLKIDRVGVNDNFFRRGGHSLLLAAQLRARVSKVLHVELPLRCVLEEPTVAQLALRVESAQAEGRKSPALAPVPREGRLPVSSQQYQVLRRIFEEKEDNHFNMRRAFRIKGRLDVVALEASFAEIIRRHESLRTSFAQVEGAWTQVVNPPANFELGQIDLRDLPAVEREREVRRLAIAEIARRFDLLSGAAVLRACLARLAEEEYALIIVMHHIAGDGWSFILMNKELSELYYAYAAGGASTLPEVSYQYADYAHWQNQQLQGETYEELLSYWTRQLEDIPYTMALPTDYPRPLKPAGRPKQEYLTLPPTLIDQLKELGHRERVSLFILLLAAYKTTLYRHAGIEDILVWANIANRTHAELEGVIGNVANEIVLRTKISGELTFRQLLGRVREVALGAYKHQAMPYSVLEKRMEGKVAPGASPLIQFEFSLQTAGDFSSRSAPLPSLGIPPVVIEAEERIEDEERRMRPELEMYVYESEGVVVLAYNANLFKPETAAALVNGFAALLGSIVADPEQTLDSLQYEANSLVTT